MRALSVASECAPLIKTGGLADVVGALPGALTGQGVALRTLIPGYPGVMGQIREGQVVAGYDDFFGGAAQVVQAREAGLDLLLLDVPHLFRRDGAPYLGPDGHDWPDNPERFAALSWAAAVLARAGVGDWQPDLVHAHDWQGGLTPYYLRGSGIPTILTIHNIAFQGLAPVDRMAALRLDPADFRLEGFEYWGKISALKAGLVYADRITAVSPTYARELMTPEFGMGMDGVLRARRVDFCGILNGIDEAVWNPATDALITPYQTPGGKARNRAALLEEFGLSEGEGPLCVVVSRLTEQKGLDLLLEALPALMARGGRLALLGCGDRALEAAWREAADRHEGVAVRIGYDEDLSHRMVAGGDAILVPSRFEPCGLTQLYGLRYGTIPVVALTGGLADTVINANDAACRVGAATGLQFHPLTAEALGGVLERLCDLYSDRQGWVAMQRNAMSHPVGWEASAIEYAALYRKLLA